MKCYYQRKRILYNQNVCKLTSRQLTKPINNKIIITEKDYKFLKKYNLLEYLGGKNIEIRG